MIQQLSSQLLQLSERDRRVFANDVVGLETRMMPASSVALNYPHQVSEERWITSTPFMVKNQLTHQEIGTSNLQQITSNLGTLLPKPVLWIKG